MVEHAQRGQPLTSGQLPQQAGGADHIARKINVLMPCPIRKMGYCIDTVTHVTCIGLSKLCSVLAALFYSEFPPKHFNISHFFALCSKLYAHVLRNKEERLLVRNTISVENDFRRMRDMPTLWWPRRAFPTCRSDVGPMSGRCRADVAAMALRRRADVAAMALRRRSDVAVMALRRRCDGAPMYNMRMHINMSTGHALHGRR